MFHFLSKFARKDYDIFRYQKIHETSSFSMRARSYMAPKKTAKKKITTTSTNLHETQCVVLRDPWPIGRVRQRYTLANHYPLASLARSSISIWVGDSTDSLGEPFLGSVEGPAMALGCAGRRTRVYAAEVGWQVCWQALSPARWIAASRSRMSRRRCQARSISLFKNPKVSEISN